jgi:hypothetical protein
MSQTSINISSQISPSNSLLYKLTNYKYIFMIVGGLIAISFILYFILKKNKPVDCQLSEWIWDECICEGSINGQGQKFAHKNIIQKAQYGGKECSTDQNDYITSESCSCPVPTGENKPVDCQLSEWIWDDECICEGPIISSGQKFAHRNIIQKAKYGGKECPTDQNDYITSKSCSCPVPTGKNPYIDCCEDKCSSQPTRTGKNICLKKCTSNPENFNCLTQNQ